MKTQCILAAAALVAFGSTTAFAAAYRVPEQSISSVAKAGANIAYTPGADAAYFNPANMGWLEKRGYLEADLAWIHLPGITYSDARLPAYSGESDEEDFLLPTFFAVSPDYNNFRVGLSLTYPYGLSKQWSQPYPATFAEEFTLTTYDMNASGSYTFNQFVSVAAGLRLVYADATVRSSGVVAPGGVTASRDMDGDTWEWGYNLALSVKPTPQMNLSATYRSKVDLDLEGTAHLSTNVGPSTYNGPGAVTVPMPAVLGLAASYTFFEQLTAEFTYERIFWSDYETLDFSYPVSLGNPVLIGAFDSPKIKDWEDSNTFRIGLTYDTKKSFILMAGFALDETPIPGSTVGFDLPDDDSRIYSLGVRYLASERLEFGLGYLYVDKDDRTVNNRIAVGEFSDIAAHVFSFGVSWKL